jgi:hypothetical protein
MNPNNPNFGREIIDLEEVDFTPELWSCIPAAIARKYRVLPVAQKGRCLVVALAHAGDLNAIDNLHNAVGHKFDTLEILIADESQIDFFVEEIYGEDEDSD